MLIVLFLIAGFILANLYVKWRYTFWSSRGFPYLEPEFFSGNVRGMGISEFQAITMDRIYKKCKGMGPIAGVYFFTTPTALVLDADILKHILIKDFEYFQDRGLFVSEYKDPLSGHLFALEGDRWRQIRTRVTPTFTSGKLRGMTGLMIDTAHNLVDYLSELEDQSVDKKSKLVLEVKDLISRYSTDVIASVAYGLETNTLRDSDSKLRDLGKHIFHSTFLRNVYMMMINLFRKQAKALGLRFIEKENEDFFMSMIKSTVEYRERTGYQRNDFINLLIELKKNGMIDGDQVGHLSMNEVAAMCFTFFLAGYETSPNVITFCLYELCLRPDIQEKLRKEIIAHLEKHDNQLTYDSSRKIPYLEQVIKETMRKWPPVSNLMRMTKKDYKIPGIKLTLPKDIWLMIPIYSIQRDEEYFPNPDEFIPERFSPENETNRSTFHYLPFGEGPRMCLGDRFGLQEVRLTLIALLTKFQFKLSPKTTVPVELLPQVMAILAPKSGVWMEIETLKNPYHYGTEAT